ncbi:hypothetical protein A2Z33_06185 [Candidatus Gottesmanbacteria bacterium RBG_16_52_11]|uniref:Thioredoxin domain-containing protein n=1 Tax=Candidatus Gottesmanbacteria bacterium RBG_16_52_11 TaxID=1798374 RepID=A0A1F5YY91_9BACT|nr:MAG: hypothetical protein A2Z33_06185 [Candidatus Gottesmanbacteria bacterium RBG_16_52_11]
MPVMVTLLILASFFLGSLWTKVQILEKSGLRAQATAPVPTDDNQPSGNVLPVDAQPPAVQPATKKPVITGDDYFRGNKNAKVTLVEYSDLECPFCKRFHPTMKQVIEEYGDKVKWVYRHYPLSFHANAQKEAEATECAGKLGGNDAFWKYVDAILDRTTSNGTGFALDQLAPLAKELGLNSTKFQSCLDSGEFTQKVKDEIATGSQEGVTGTPGTIIIDASGNTQLIPGALPFEQVKPIIDNALSV